MSLTPRGHAMTHRRAAPDTTDRPAHWTDHAACKGMDTEAWFPHRGEPNADVLAVCHTCPVQPDCLNHALTLPEREGIWGGTTAKRRVSIRRKASRAATNARKDTP